ncbi:MAG: prepilin-type N-terminal cleavage/methylation domain-containing protein [bacterium]|nr:prepilin-type N-terminal cleavage/methylation domain-containing protein [bacterium]
MTEKHSAFGDQPSARGAANHPLVAAAPGAMLIPQGEHDGGDVARKHASPSRHTHSHAGRWPWHARTAAAVRRASAFSLAELMIAIAILGLGLLVVASMFPIAWSKARDLSQHTAATAVAEAAAITFEQLARVDGASECLNYTSFAGDYVVETKAIIIPTGLPHSSFNKVPVDAKAPSDTYVHPLSMENALMDVPPSGGVSPVITEGTWLLMDGSRSGSDDLYWLDVHMDLGTVCGGEGTRGDILWYDQPQVLFHQRVHPALAPYPVGGSDPELQEWQDRLETRRYAWAVFHRLNEPILHPTPPATSAQHARFIRERRAAARTPRQFTLYYVTLRRNPGQRFCRQDEDAAATSGSNIALPHTVGNLNDVMFPTPWLVPLVVPQVVGGSRALNYRDNTLSTQKDVVPRGLPTEVLVEADLNAGDDIREFFPPGTWFIDSVNGETYRVTKRRLSDAGFGDSRFVGNMTSPVEALLTLDREIFVDDLFDPGVSIDPPYNQVPGTVPVASRRVWVFPPAIERVDSTTWLVQGASPVADVNTRFKVIYPD